MLGFLAVLLALLVAAFATPVERADSAGFAIFQDSNPNIISCTITAGTCSNAATFTAATCNGSADDLPAFASFNTMARAQAFPIRLTIPSGAVCEFITNVGPEGRFWSSGIKGLKVYGYGATLQDGPSNTGAGYDIGGSITGGGIFCTGNVVNSQCTAGCEALGAGYCTARVASVSAGATSVTLLTPSENVRFQVGGYVMIAGLDIQGSGEPINAQFWEFVKIQSINPATGTITFTSPLANSYESTWPNYSTVAGIWGQASIWALNADYENTNPTFYGLRFDIPDRCMFVSNNTVIVHDSVFTGCVDPSALNRVEFYNTTFLANSMEADKLVDTIILDHVTFTDGVGVGVDNQSSSINNVIIRNGSVINGFGLKGTTKHTTISDSTLKKVTAGAHNYGVSTDLTCTNSTMTALAASTAQTNYDFTTGSISGGVITAPNSVEIGGLGGYQFAVPGARAFFVHGSFETSALFTVTDISTDNYTPGGAGNTMVSTSMSTSSFPPSGSFQYILSQAPKLYFTNCSGSQLASGVSNPNGYGLPIYAYANYTYVQDPANTIAIVYGEGHWWGKITSITFNVTKAYTGVNTPIWMQMNANNMQTVKNNGTTYNYAPNIDLATAGKRVITPAGVTCDTGGGPMAGGCGGDFNLTVPEAIWFGGYNGPTGFNFTQDIHADSSSVWPTVTIEWIGNQSACCTP